MTLGLLSSTPFPPPPPAAWPAAARLLRAPPPSSRLPPVAPSAPRESAVPHARAAGFYKAVSPPLALVYFEFDQKPRVSRLPIVLLSPLFLSYSRTVRVLYRVLPGTVPGTLRTSVVRVSSFLTAVYTLQYSNNSNTVSPVQLLGPPLQYCIYKLRFTGTVPGYSNTLQYPDPYLYYTNTSSSNSTLRRA